MCQHGMTARRSCSGQSSIIGFLQTCYSWESSSLHNLDGFKMVISGVMGIIQFRKRMESNQNEKYIRFYVWKKDDLFGEGGLLMACQQTTAGIFAPRADWDDPIQGAAASCALISALSSVAWVYWPAFNVSCQNPADPLAPKLWKVDGSGNPSGLLPCCKVEKNFEFGNAHSSDQGIWPAVYEKAYIKALNNCPVGRDADYCNVSQYNAQFPQKTAGLVALTGWSKYQFNPSGSLPSYPEAYTNISGKCEGSRRTKVPMVAWTKTAANWPDQYNAGQPVSETNRPLGYDQMRPDHCYSILGYIPDQYIVLRNPRALSESSYSGTGHLLSDGTVFHAGGTIYPYNKGNMDTSTSRNIAQITLNKSIGLFALRKDQFQRYFLEYGWVK